MDWYWKVLVVVCFLVWSWGMWSGGYVLGQRNEARWWARALKKMRVGE